MLWELMWQHSERWPTVTTHAVPKIVTLCIVSVHHFVPSFAYTSKWKGVVTKIDEYIRKSQVIQLVDAAVCLGEMCLVIN